MVSFLLRDPLTNFPSLLVQKKLMTRWGRTSGPCTIFWVFAGLPALGHCCGFHIGIHQQGCRPPVMPPFTRPWTLRPLFPWLQVAWNLSVLSASKSLSTSYSLPSLVTFQCVLATRNRGTVLGPSMETPLPTFTSELSPCNGATLNKAPSQTQGFPPQPTVLNAYALWQPQTCLDV